MMRTNEKIATLEDRALTDEEIKMLVDYEAAPEGAAALVVWEAGEIRIREPIPDPSTYLDKSFALGTIGAGVQTDQQARDAWADFKRRRLSHLRAE